MGHSLPRSCSLYTRYVTLSAPQQAMAFSTSRAALLACLLAMLLVSPAAAVRQLLQANCDDSPGKNRPDECSNTLGIGGNQWDNNEIECHVCKNVTETYQLKCNLNFHFTSNNTIDCELDQGPLHSAINFSCDIVDCTIKCDWNKLQQTIPGCAYTPIKNTIFQNWHPKSNAAQLTG